MKIRQKRKGKLFCVSIMCIICSLMLYSPVTAQNDHPGSTDSDEATEPTVIQWYLLGDRPQELDIVSEKANSYIRKKLNAEVNFNFIDWGALLVKKAILFNSGTQVDIIFAAGWWDYEEDVSNGYYFPLNGLLDEFAPQTKAILGQDLLKAAEIDDRIYALPIPGQGNSFASGIGFRKDLVKKYNIDLSKIKKIEDVEPILKSIKSKQPSIIPLINKSTTLNYDILNLDNISSALYSPGCVNVNSKDMKVINEFTKAETKAFYKNLNRFYKLKYIKKPKDLYDNSENSKAFAILNTDYNPLSLSDSAVSERVNIYLSKPTISNSSGTGCMNAISSKTVDPELDLKLIELINTDKYLNNLLHFGVEGRHYVKSSDNVIKYPSGINQSNTPYPQYINWMIGNRYMDFTFNFEDKNIYKTLRAFNSGARADKTLGFRYKPDDSKEEVACLSVWNKYVPKLISGEYDPDKYLPVINKEFKKAGIDKIIAQKQKQLDSWIKSQCLIQ